MKKLSILALAAILVIFFTVPASALENEFGGYWRTRYFSQKYFSGFDRGDDINAAEEASDDTIERADTRTRLYYTAKINDNLKLVNKFEMDAVFGDQSDATSNYGDVGADGIAVEVKNSYADFNLGPVNVTAGVQPYSLFRDFQISDDASGIIARWKAMDNFILAGSWLKAIEGGEGDLENEDVDVYTITGAFWFNENISLKPSISTTYSDELNADTLSTLLLFSSPASAPFVDTTTNAGEAYLVTYGADFDMTFDKWGLWATAYGQTGEVEDVNLTALAGGGDEDFDISAFLFAVGGNVGFGEVGFLGDFGLHSEFFYASGDDDPDDDDVEGVINPFGSYYWSEIMGLGIFDNRASAGSSADKVTNIWAVNLGVDMKPMDKLKIAVDVWYAERVEDEQIPNSEDELGTELDVLITYELVEGLNLDLVGAYLWADDATAGNFDDDKGIATEENEEDPYEYGVRLSLSF
ncbi:MAG: hypothetical protein QNJ02_16195 [Desulfobacterales bacterium]|nr:hypothetical protein [Desulfobacterales bacterium]